MNLDVRYPMGLLFAILGGILLVFGFVSDKQIYETHSLGQNVNIIWGTIFALFGGVMLFLSRRKAS